MIEAWKIGVSIAMSSNAAQVLGAIQKDLFGLRREADLTTTGLNRMKLAAVGAMTAIAGAAVLKGMWSMVEAAKDLAHQQTMLRQLGVSNADVAASTASSWKAAGDVLGTNVARNLELLREAKGAFGTVQEAQDLLPSLARADVIRSNANGGTSDDRGLQMVMKAIEMRGDVRYVDGQLDVQAAERGLNAALKFLNASGGQVDESALKGLITMAGPMAKMMGPDQFYRMMLTATEELGQKAGTALSAAGRALYGGIMPQRNVVEMERMGLINPSAVHVRRGGNVSVDQGGLTGFDMLNEQGLPGWVNTVLAPQLHRDFLRQAALHPKLQESQYDQQEMYRLFPTETMRRLVGLFIQQAGGVAKGAANYDAAQGLDAYRTIMGQATVSDRRRDRDAYGVPDKIQADPTAKMVAFTEAWKNLTTALGTPMIDTANLILGKLTDWMNGLALWAAKPENAAMVGILEKITAGLAATGVVLGTFAVGAGMLGLVGLPGRLKALESAVTAFGGGKPANLAMGSLIGKLGLLAARFLIADQALKLIDPNDKTGSWIDQNVPGASFLDNLASKLGLGRSYKEQADAAGQQVPSVPIAPSRSFVRGAPGNGGPTGSADDPIHTRTAVTNGRDLARGVTAGQARDAARPNAGTIGPDPRFTPDLGLLGAGGQ